ncbi:hypothetical protein PMV_058 [Port-miou virus]|uniref:Uncharacterized protein n=1 Tax=Port-miou virus TaxID=1733873 RepID=A0A0N9PVB4_9VIRU|nr:hypothetical protein PMV_058 [Port-miou virus]
MERNASQQKLREEHRPSTQAKKKYTLVYPKIPSIKIFLIFLSFPLHDDTIFFCIPLSSKLSVFRNIRISSELFSIPISPHKWRLSTFLSFKTTLRPIIRPLNPSRKNFGEHARKQFKNSNPSIGTSTAWMNFRAKTAELGIFGP